MNKKTQIKKTCLICGKELYVIRSRNHSKKYCSKECLYKSQMNREKRVCPICKRIFVKRKGLLQVSCSNECGIKLRILTRKKNYKSKKIKRKCLTCGKKFYVYPSTLKKGINCGKFCSKNCRMTYILKGWWKIEKYKNNYLKRLREVAKPNKAEIFLDNLLQTNFPNKWKYVGNSLIIGKKSPDFIYFDSKKIILLHGVYWHLLKFKKIYPNLSKDEVERKDIEYYKKLEYDTLIIWENELKGVNKLIEKINKFNNKIINGD